MTAVIFDLDDTLYKEVDYVRSGYEYVVRRLASKLRVPREDLAGIVESAGKDGVHPFDALYEHIGHRVSVACMVNWYRKHVPFLILPESTRRCLSTLLEKGYILGMITDGRKVGQWNKIHALGLDRFIPRELISVSGEIGAEKEKEKPWRRMMELIQQATSWWYVGDNPRKDFLHPNTMGWNTVMLADDGRNVKTQNVELPDAYYARYTISSLEELAELIR